MPTPYLAVKLSRQVCCMHRRSFVLLNVVIFKVLILSWNKDLEINMKTQEYVFN